MLQKESFELYDWYKSLKEAHLVLSFKGDFNQELTKALLILTQNRERIKTESISAQTRLLGVLVECIQNICNHGVTSVDNSNLVPGIVLLGKAAEKFTISTGNLILKENVSKLVEKLTKIQGMSLKEMKTEQRNIILNSELSESGNAGIGFLHIARKACQPIKFEFKKIDKQTSLFCFEVTLSIHD